MQCPHCSYKCGASVRSLRLHIQKMHSTSNDRYARLDHFSDFQPVLDADVDSSHFNLDIYEASEDKYLNFQRTFVEKLKQHSREQCMSKVKTTEGLYKSGNKRVYMLILMYISSRPHISEADATALLDLLKEVTSIDGIEIPLPSR